jgi:hypothetical protein
VILVSLVHSPIPQGPRLVRYALRAVLKIKQIKSVVLNVPLEPTLLPLEQLLVLLVLLEHILIQTLLLPAHAAVWVIFPVQLAAAYVLSVLWVTFKHQQASRRVLHALLDLFRPR